MLSFIPLALMGCDSATQNTDLTGVTEATSAFDEFSGNVLIYADGDEIVLEANGLPDHTSPYWSEGHELYVEPTVAAMIVPGNIDDFNGTITAYSDAMTILFTSQGYGNGDGWEVSWEGGCQWGILWGANLGVRRE